MPDVRPHRDAILTALTAVANLNVFDGPPQVTPPHDGDKKVHPYAALYVGAGEPEPSSLAWAHEDLDLPFQVTCVGGDMTRCLWAVDEVRAALLDQRLTVAGRSLSRIAPDGSSGPPRVDNDTTPPRLYVPLLMRLRSVPA